MVIVLGCMTRLCPGLPPALLPFEKQSPATAASLDNDAAGRIPADLDLFVFLCMLVLLFINCNVYMYVCFVMSVYVLAYFV